MKRKIGPDIRPDWSRRLSTIDMLADFSLFTLLVFLQHQLLLAINSYFIFGTIEPMSIQKCPNY